MKNQFIEEIQSQPKALHDTLAYYEAGEGRMMLKKVCELWRSGSYDKFVFTGMGSSYFLAYAASSLLNSCGIASCVVNAGELLHYQLATVDRRCLTVCISQSGESFEIVELLRKFPSETKILSVTNECSSTLAGHSDVCLLTKAGKEEMTSSKTFVTAYLVIYLLYLELTDRLTAEAFAEVGQLVQSVGSMLDKSADGDVNNAVQWLGDTRYIQLIARGPLYATARQTALMFMEATSTASSAMLGGEFRHGPMEMVGKGFRAIILAADDGTYPQCVKMATDIVRFGGKVVFVTNGSEIAEKDIYSITLECANNELFPISSIIPLQLIVNAWALSKGMIPGSFAKGAKVTVVE